MVGNEDALALFVPVSQLECLVFPAFVLFQKSQHLSKDLRGIPPVDLLDDNNKGTVTLGSRGVQGFKEDAVHARELTVSVSPPAPHEILVGQPRIELNHPHSLSGHLPILRPYQDNRQAIAPPP